MSAAPTGTATISSAGPLPAHGGDRGPHGGAGRQAVVDDDHHPVPTPSAPAGHPGNAPPAGAARRARDGARRRSRQPRCLSPATTTSFATDLDRSPTAAMAPIASSGCPGTPSLRTISTSSLAPSAAATSAATGTPPRGRPSTTTSSRPEYPPSSAASARPAAVRSANRVRSVRRFTRPVNPWSPCWATDRDSSARPLPWPIPWISQSAERPRCAHQPAPTPTPASSGSLGTRSFLGYLRDSTPSRTARSSSDLPPQMP